MLPNLSNSSTAAVKSRNLFFKGKKPQTKVIKQYEASKEQ